MKHEMTVYNALILKQRLLLVKETMKMTVGRLGKPKKDQFIKA